MFVGEYGSSEAWHTEHGQQGAMTILYNANIDAAYGSDSLSTILPQREPLIYAEISLRAHRRADIGAVGYVSRRALPCLEDLPVAHSRR